MAANCHPVPAPNPCSNKAGGDAEYYARSRGGVPGPSPPGLGGPGGGPPPTESSFPDLLHYTLAILAILAILATLLVRPAAPTSWGRLVPGAGRCPQPAAI